MDGEKINKIIKSRLKNKEHDFTVLDKYCSDTLISKPDLLEINILREIALELNVSEATISRYFKKIGFSSFSEFKFWKKELENEKILQNNLITDIQRTLNHLNDIDFDIFLSTLKKYQKIYISGRGESKFLAQSLERKLTKVNLNTTFINISDFDTIENHYYSTRKNIAWIIISISAKSIPFYLEKEKQNFFQNCDLILLSAQKPSEKYFKYFQYIFYGHPLIEFNEKEKYMPLNSQILLNVVINFIIEKLLKN